MVQKYFSLKPFNKKRMVQETTKCDLIFVKNTKQYKYNIN